MNPKILPTIMMVLSVGASVGYLFAKDYRHAIYWLASAVLMCAVTY